MPRKKTAAEPTGYDKLPLDEALTRLDAIVEKLESEDTALEESIALYREGRLLGAACLTRLQALEEQIVQIREATDGALVEEPFEE
ncbi:MAG: exodeoxyribonuclease VII small subunit [Candidatus Sumerlaeia bacterium]|nr:exodeoxyribonuclease VII small subunit [Candidatus Sumerlaeia bacterium]